MPPSISDFHWQPTRVVNAKIYDGNASFSVESSSPSQIHLEFDPDYPSEIPATAVLEEAGRSFDYSASAGVQSYSQQISDLKGGKRYRLAVTARDSVGNQSQGSLEVPYVREFEIAEASGANVGVYYIPWEDLTHYLGTGDLKASKLTPLLGWYGFQTFDPFFISTHIDWSTGHKMNSWLVGWFGNDGRLNKIFSNPLAGDLKIGVFYVSDDLLTLVVNKDGWPTIDLDNSSNMAKLAGDMEVLARDFFSSPQFWKINNKPVIFLCHSRYFIGDVPNAIGRLRDIAQDKGFKPFFVGDEVYYYESPHASADWLKSYDALSAYALHANNNAGVTSGNYEARLDSLFNLWSKRGKLIPIAMPGFEHIDQAARTYDPKNLDGIDRNPDKFTQRIQIAKRYMSPELSTLMIVSFNDWFDNSQIEPTNQEGFTYLDTIKENL